MTTSRSRRAATLALLALAALLPARGDGATRHIGAYDTFFSPRVVTAAMPDDTLTWDVNQGTHTVTSYTGPVFDSGPLPAPASYSVSFPGGTVRYRCTIHSTLSDSLECSGMCGYVTEEETVDLERPTARITQPSFAVAFAIPSTNGETVTIPVRVAGTATDNVKVARVGLRVYPVVGQAIEVPQTQCGRCRSARDVTWFEDLSLLPGRYTIEAIATDTSENSRSSEPVTVIVA